MNLIWILTQNANKPSSDMDVTTELTQARRLILLRLDDVKKKDPYILELFRRMFPGKQGLFESSMRGGTKGGVDGVRLGLGHYLCARSKSCTRKSETQIHPLRHGRHETEQLGKPVGRGTWGQARLVSPRPCGHGGSVPGQGPGRLQRDHERTVTIPVFPSGQVWGAMVPPTPTSGGVSK